MDLEQITSLLKRYERVSIYWHGSHKEWSMVVKKGNYQEKIISNDAKRYIKPLKITSLEYLHQAENIHGSYALSLHQNQHLYIPYFSALIRINSIFPEYKSMEIGSKGLFSQRSVIVALRHINTSEMEAETIAMETKTLKWEEFKDIIYMQILNLVEREFSEGVQTIKREDTQHYSYISIYLTTHSQRPFEKIYGECGKLLENEIISDFYRVALNLKGKSFYDRYTYIDNLFSYKCNAYKLSKREHSLEEALKRLEKIIRKEEEQLTLITQRLMLFKYLQDSAFYHT